MMLDRLGLVSAMGLCAAVSFGCSSPVPPTPQGGYFVHFRDSGANCNIMGHDAKLGDVDSTARNRVVVDGTEGATIDCKVSGSSSFSVDATAIDSTKAVGLGIIINGLAPGATVDAPAKGAVSFSSPTTGGQAAQSSACDFYFTPGTQEGIAAGRVWVTFRCDSLLLDADDCSIDESFALFENCEQ